MSKYVRRNDVGIHKTISVAWLREQHASKNDIAIFERIEGDAEIPLTRINLRNLAISGFCTAWLPPYVLSGCEEKKYFNNSRPQLAREVYYDDMQDSHWARYMLLCAEALADIIEEDGGAAP